MALTDRVLRVGALEGAAAAERVLQEAIHDALRELASGAAPTTKTRRRKTRPARKPAPQRRMRT